MPTKRGLHNAGVVLGKEGGKISAAKRKSSSKKSAMPTKKKAAVKKKPTAKKAAAKKKAAPKKAATKKNAGVAKLKKINTRAQAIYKGGKGGMKWTTAIKRAAKDVK